MQPVCKWCGCRFCIKSVNKIRHNSTARRTAVTAPNAYRRRFPQNNKTIININTDKSIFVYFVCAKWLNILRTLRSTNEWIIALFVCQCKITNKLIGSACVLCALYWYWAALERRKCNPAHSSFTAVRCSITETHCHRHRTHCSQMQRSANLIIFFFFTF